jgi:hypothetical protein
MRNKTLLLTGMLAALILIGLAQSGRAQADVYILDWWTVDGGGGARNGGGYAVMDTSGQHDAGVLTGNGYTLTGGFWGGASLGQAPTPTPIPDSGYKNFLPMIQKR